MFCGLFLGAWDSLTAHAICPAPGHLQLFSSMHWRRPLPEEAFGAASLERPLIGRRDGMAELGERLDSLPLLERLLRCEAPEAHAAVAAALWDSASDGEAIAALEALADASVAAWEAAVRDGSGREEAITRG